MSQFRSDLVCTRIGLAAVALVLSLAAVTPAAAEFFGCNDPPAKAIHSSRSSMGAHYRAKASYTHEFAAQSRPRVVIHPRRLGPNAKRECRSWLAKEYRVSGPVIVPHRQCWWR